MLLLFRGEAEDLVKITYLKVVFKIMEIVMLIKKLGKI